MRQPEPHMGVQNCMRNEDQYAPVTLNSFPRADDCYDEVESNPLVRVYSVLGVLLVWTWRFNLTV